MEPKFQTSFIPKKPIDTDSRNRPIINTETDMLTLTANIIFIASLLLFGGLFLFSSLLDRQISQLDTELNSASSSIEPEKIREIIKNNSRIDKSLSILESHQATSRLLKFLGDSAIRRIKFSELSYQNRDNIPSITISSEVGSYNGLAYQEQILRESEYIKNHVFSDISLDDNGSVKFKFTGRIDPELVSYKKLIESSITINE